MVSNDVVLQTIKRMISTGVDDNTIRITLRGINLQDREIENLINEAKGISPSAPVPAASESDGGESDEDVGAEEGEEGEFEDEAGADAQEDVKSAISDSSQEQMAHHATTHNILDQHSAKMEDIHNDVTALHEKIDSAPRLSSEDVAKLAALDTRMSALEREIGETKANTIALQELLKKILETDRKTLLEVQKK